jgi:hypothetical protein
LKPGDQSGPPKRGIDIEGEPFEIHESGHASTTDADADGDAGKTDNADNAEKP